MMNSLFPAGKPLEIDRPYALRSLIVATTGVIAVMKIDDVASAGHGVGRVINKHIPKAAVFRNAGG